MKLQGDYLFEASVEEVWSALFDPVVLAAVMPGCEKLERVEGRYVGDLNIKVGPVQGKFSGKVELKDVDAPKRYTMVIDGRGAPGFVKATALVELEAEGDHTRMRYDADAHIGGKIASVGQRLLEASARAISKQSLEGLHENIKIRSAAAAQARAAAEDRADAAARVVEAEAAGEAKAAPAPPAPEEPPPPPVLKAVDQKALAAGVAREVTRSLLPPPVMIAIAIGVLALVGWLVLRTVG
jgi:carbon monoxide dehydrogenase subunit G